MSYGAQVFRQIPVAERLLLVVQSLQLVIPVLKQKASKWAFASLVSLMAKSRGVQVWTPGWTLIR